MTTALEGGEWSAACLGRTLPPGKTRYPLYRGLGPRPGLDGRKNSSPPRFFFDWYDFIQCSVVVYTRYVIGNKKSVSDVLLSVVFWCVLVRSLYSLLDVHSLWFQLWCGCSTFPFSYSCPWLKDVRLLRVMSSTRSYYKAVMDSSHSHLWQRGSFPHSFPLYATDTASTLTIVWSRWSLVTSVPVAVGLGIWLDWPTPATLHFAALVATVWNWRRRSQSLGIRSGIVRRIQARRCFVHVHICYLSPHSVWRWINLSVLSHFFCSYLWVPCVSWRVFHLWEGYCELPYTMPL